jgi:cytochrome c
MIAVLAVISATGLGYVHPFGNPRVEEPSGAATLLKGATIPPDARAVLVNKCADCHSSETRWPLYAHVAPGSWLIERDIVEARKYMNLSRWDLLSMEDQEVLLAKISHEAKSGEMPPLQYLAMHWGARLSPAEVQTLSLLGKSTGKSEATGPGTGDATHGKMVFDKRCTGCHSLEINGEGPKLAGVYGRKAGSVPGFDYSQGLKNSGIIWGDATLDKWLSGPDSVVPDAKMDFYVPKASERQDLIAYFKELKQGPSRVP